MKTTFLIETTGPRPEVFNYYSFMFDAKYQLKRLPEGEYCILVLRGPYYGEGWHDYRLFFENSKFKKRK